MNSLFAKHEERYIASLPPSFIQTFEHGGIEVRPRAVKYLEREHREMTFLIPPDITTSHSGMFDQYHWYDIH